MFIIPIKVGGGPGRSLCVSHNNAATILVSATCSVRHRYAIPAGYMDMDTTDTDTDDHICICRHTRIHILVIHTRHGGYGSSSLLYYVEYTVID